MPRPLRSNLPRGSSHWAVRRAQWAALGITEAELEKPKIAIVNSSSDLAICFSHLDGVAREVRAGIREAGGLAFEVRTTAPSDFIHSAGRAGRYILPSRDLIANDIEVQVEGAQLDGMVLLASCDKTLPGQLMAAARLDIPTIVVICGYQPSGEWKGHEVDIEEVFLAAGHHAAGRLSLEDLSGMADNAIRGPGVCAGMGTANSMHVVGEALGMTLPGAAPVLANSPAMFAQARAAGARIVAMVEEDLRPRRILTEGAFGNALTALLSVAGSINCIKHLQAVAAEAGLALDMRALAERLSERVPVLCAIRPIGTLPTEAMEQAGGTYTLLSRLRTFLDEGALTVTGRSLGAVLDDAPAGDARVIRHLAEPLSTRPGIVTLRGSLCPGGGLVKLGLTEGRVLEFEGRARVFETVDSALGALREGRIVGGDVMVLRNLGVRGAPGMGMASRVVFALDGLGLGPSVAMVTDGQLSGLVNKGLVVGECAPEAAEAGPIGLVREGDRIRIDIRARRADLLVEEAELAARRAAHPRAGAVPPPGWLSIYARTAKPLEAGATLHDPPEV